MENIIEVEHFTKKYGDFTAVDDISFCVKEGSIFSFLGPNGAGKSTTINTLCTILDKTEGNLYIGGHDVSKQRNLVRKDIGIVFQESTLDLKLTVEENLKFHCDFYGVPRSETENRIDFVLDLVDLKDRKKDTVGSLSGGMKRRVEIARGLVHFPKVLFLDEPTSGLDPQTRANVWDYIHRLQQQKNITIFLTTHYMDEAEISSGVAIIDHGNIVAYGTPDELKAQFTSTKLKMTAENPEEMSDFLSHSGIRFSQDKCLFKIPVKSTEHAIDFLSGVKKNIKDFEVTKGSLNDVFLAVTGKEIRE
ncbi:MAG: ATP-binding cassette domain-containing protein [Clostridia bacterium]|jgi:ABC-2 type transport system ATP-binding protein|nr:ATP-binding cassette domain-containing protein [Clostridia bacterium]MCI2000095.1 ATP-binding cassette domain-containing protein [Clostridia bacterium]MCI2014371.1 ATP-binding cassette domain-containing protein [Clostridia bacterium]